MSLGKDWLKLRQEYPTTPEEAFIASGSPYFYNESIFTYIQKAPEPEQVGRVELVGETPHYQKDQSGDVKIWEFPAEDGVKKQLDRLFSQILSLPPNKLKDNLFARPQVLFSLMMVLGSLTKAPTGSALERCVLDLDARVNAVRIGENPTALNPDIYEAFTTGNMHRIRFRRSREDEIKSYFC